jgi:hypothetical protein
LNRTGNAGRRLAKLRESSLSRQKGEAFEKLFMKQQRKGVGFGS